MRKYAIGIDIGGSHVSCAAVDLEKLQLLEDTFSENEVDNKEEANIILNLWADTIRKTMNKIPGGEIAGLGFAMPGPFDYVNGICLMKGVEKYDKLYGYNIGEEISAILKLDDNTPVRFMNDATSFAVGVSWFGVGRGSKKVIAITLGTGFGSAFIDEGVPVVDGPGIPELACLYHLPYKDSNADSNFSTRWFQKRYRELTGKETPGVKELADVAHIPDIQSLFDEFGHNLAEFMSPWLSSFNAETLVIGGNISGAFKLFSKTLLEDLRNNGVQTKVGVSILKESAAMIGSARLLEDDFWNRVSPKLEKM